MYKITKQVIENDIFTIIEVIHEKIEVSFMDFGATVLDIKTPDKDGKLESVIMSYQDITSYIDGEMYLNSIVGPVAGRIKNGEYCIDDSLYVMDKNFLETESLHSGKDCLGYKFFDYEILEEDQQTQVIFKYYSKESGSNFPGNQLIQIYYTIKDTELKIEFIGDTTEDTLLNLTSHLYFNLSGNMKRTVLDNTLYINASRTLALDDKFVPIRVESLLGTYLDFTKPKLLQSVFTEDIYKRPEYGIDNPYLLDDIGYERMQASIVDPISKRKLDVFTTYPSIVCYTHNFPDNHLLKFNRNHEKHLGICFETQNPPNGINIDGLEDSILREGNDYYHKTLYKFSVKE